MFQFESLGCGTRCEFWSGGGHRESKLNEVTVRRVRRNSKPGRSRTPTGVVEDPNIDGTVIQSGTPGSETRPPTPIPELRMVSSELIERKESPTSGIRQDRFETVNNIKI